MCTENTPRIGCGPLLLDPGWKVGERVCGVVLPSIGHGLVASAFAVCPEWLVGPKLDVMKGMR